MGFIRLLIPFFIFSTIIPVYAQDFAIKEVKLSVTYKKIPAELVLPQSVDTIFQYQDTLIFVGKRGIWERHKNQRPQRLINPLNHETKIEWWYETAILIDDILLVSAADYPEQSRLHNISVKRGGFKAGPKSVGLLEIDLKTKSYDLLSQFRVTNDPPPKGVVRPKRFVNPSPQSMIPYETGVLVGGYGYLMFLNLDQKTASYHVIDEMLRNRNSLLANNKTIWYTADDGGINGNWIEKKTDDRIDKIWPLNYHLTGPDAMVFNKGKLWISSLAGLIEIDENARTQTHYMLTNDPKKMRTYRLQQLAGKFTAIREDGWVVYDLANKKATLYQFENQGLSNNIFHVNHFSGTYYIANQSAVYKYTPAH